MANEEKPALHIGEVNQHAKGNVSIQGDIVDGGSVKGDNATVTNTGTTTDPWEAVQDALAELAPEAQGEAAELVDQLRGLSEEAEPDESALSEIIEKLKPFKPLGRALLVAVKTTPMGAVATGLIEGAFELLK